MLRVYEAVGRTGQYNKVALQHGFACLDTDGDGRISYQEIESFVRSNINSKRQLAPSWYL